MTDLRHAFRSLRRSPGFTAIAVISLSLGIGACTAVAAVLDVLMFRGQGIGDVERVVEIYAAQNDGRAADMLPAERWALWRDADFRSFETVAARAPVSATIDPAQGLRLNGAAVSRDFFSVTRAGMHIGRALLPEDDAAGARVLVLGYGAWRDRFGGDASVIGRLLRVSGENYSVIGVAAREFGYPRGAGFWIPLRSLASEHTGPAVIGIARLAEGVTQSAAAGEVRLRSLQELAADSTKFGGMAAATLPLDSPERRNGQFETYLALAGVILVFLVGLANLTAMFLMRILSRSSEFAVRRALGASATRLVQPLIAEAALLSFAGLVGGCWIAFVARAWIGRLLIDNYSSALEPGLTLRVLAAAAGIAVLTIFVLTLVPLRAARNADVRGALQKGAATATMTRGQHRWRQALVGAQVCLAFLLVVSAVAMTRAFLNFQQANIGYDAAHVLTVRAEYKGTVYEDFAQARVLGERLAAAVRMDPNVEAVAFWRGISIGWPPRPEHAPVQEGVTEPIDGRRQLWNAYDVPPEFFATIGLDIVRGRGFGATDRAGAPLVAIITEDAARYWWPEEDALGKRVKLGTAEPWLTVVGIARSTSGLHNLARDWSGLFRKVGSSPLLFRPLAQADRLPEGWRGQGSMDANGPVIAVRTSHPAQVAPRLVTIIHGIAPDLDVARPTTLLEQQMAAWNGPELRFNSRFLTVFAALSMMLSLLGVAGMVAGSVRTRTREIGIRIALGASSVRLVAGMARGSLALAVAGLGAGGLIIVAVHKLLSGRYGFYEYAVLGFDGVTAPPLIAATAAVVAVVACAAVIGARKATKVDPMVALRVE